MILGIDEQGLWHLVNLLGIFQFPFVVFIVNLLGIFYCIAIDNNTSQGGR